MRKTTTDNRAEAVVENTESKILWDWNIRTDKELKARRTGIIVVNKTNCERVIIDAAVPGDFRIVEKENNKIVKYQESVLSGNEHRVQHTRTWVILTVNQGAEYLALLRVTKRRVDSIQ